MTFDEFTLNIGNHIVLAPPGTGKTEILSQRILYVLENNVNPNEMLCLILLIERLKI